MGKYSKELIGPLFLLQYLNQSQNRPLDWCGSPHSNLNYIMKLLFECNFSSEKSIYIIYYLLMPLRDMFFQYVKNYGNVK